VRDPQADKTLSRLVWLGLIACATPVAHAANDPAGAPPERRGPSWIRRISRQCVACHGNPTYERAPSPASLRSMSPERIYAALTTGLMKSVGDTLSEEDRRRVSESLAGQLLGSAEAGDARKMPNRCPGNPPLRRVGKRDWNGWGNGLSNSRFQSAAERRADRRFGLAFETEMGIWISGGTSAYGQPTVVAGRVFVGTDTGYVYALDASSGCVYWSYRTEAGVRNAMTVGRSRRGGQARRSAVFFGDLKANTYAIDAHSGDEIWKTRVEDNFATRVTAAPALHDGRLYVPISAWEGFQARVLDYPCCTAVGSVSALDAATGKLIWKTYTVAERPHPTAQEFTRRTTMGAGRCAHLEYANHRYPASCGLRGNGRCLHLSRGLTPAMRYWLSTRRPVSCFGPSSDLPGTIHLSSAAAAPATPRTVRKSSAPIGTSRCRDAQKDGRRS